MSLKYETEKFTIYYNDCDKRYLAKMVNVFEDKRQSILDFFKLENVKPVIKLYDNISEYKENIMEYFKKNYGYREYQVWMIANTEDGNINMLSLDLVRQINTFENYTEDEFCYNTIHEFTHVCQTKIGSTNPGWFYEVLATNLGNPECQHDIKTPFTLEELQTSFDSIDGYGAVYSIGKELFNNYDNDFIYGLVMDKDDTRLNTVTASIINDINSKLVNNNQPNKKHV